MKSETFALLLFFTSQFATASSPHASHGSEHAEIPIVVLYQAINVALILGFALYFGRNKIKAFFLNKQSAFLAAQDRAQQVLRHAEQDYLEVKNRLDKLKITRGETIVKAKTDANDLSTQIISDAEVLAAKVRGEAHLSAKLEIGRAKSQLKDQLVREAFELSKRDLAAKATSADQKKLQEDFISKVQVVQ